ncbi:MAG: hypothetical protein QM527_03425 [Alphaproteobacteria bacterium]|nr:hypothetical protein [Alphaproteobacteria bacterium]
MIDLLSNELGIMGIILMGKLFQTFCLLSVFPLNFLKIASLFKGFKRPSATTLKQVPCVP